MSGHPWWRFANTYRLLALASIRSQMQYRASFVLVSVGYLLSTGLEFLAIAVLFSRFESLQGWSLREVCILYGVVNMGFALAEGFARGFDIFAPMVKSGEFDRTLLRPLPTALQVVGRELQVMRVGRFAQGLLVLVYGAQGLPEWGPAQTALCLGAIGGCAALFAGLFVLQATAAFWTVESLELANTVTYGGTEVGQFPLAAFRPRFRAFFIWVVPLAWVNHFPVEWIVGRNPNLTTVGVWLGPLVGLGFLLVALRAWRFGERHYCSTGS